MAERRMFARTITSCTRFLRLPSAARLLYYDLGMEADDDGCVDAYGVMMRTGAAEEDLYKLVEQRFLRFLIEEELVVYITDWNRNNYLRSDRYHPGMYHDLVSGEKEEKTLENTGEDFLVHQRYTQVREDKKRQDYSSPGKESQGEERPAGAGLSCELADLMGENDRTHLYERIRCVQRLLKYPEDGPDMVAYYDRNGWTYQGRPLENVFGAVTHWHNDICGMQSFQAG